MEGEEMVKTEEILSFYPNIKIVGVGGAGNNIVSYIMEKGVSGAEIIAVNTDAAHLRISKAHKKILIGKKITKGLGAGGDPKIGEAAAKEDINELKRALEGVNLLFLVLGLGGGTGTGAGPIIAEIASDQGALVWAFAVMPTKEETARIKKAIEGLEKLRMACNTVVLLDNSKLVEFAGDKPIEEAFNMANEMIASAISGIVEEIITRTGMLQLDFADVKAIVSGGDVAALGVGESDSEQRVLDAIRKAVENPFLDIKLERCTGALVHITGGEDLGTKEVYDGCAYVRKFLTEDAPLALGVRIDKNMGRKVKVVLIITGVKSPYVLPGIKKPQEEELGIEFI